MNHSLSRGSLSIKQGLFVAEISLADQKDSENTVTLLHFFAFLASMSYCELTYRNTKLIQV